MASYISNDETQRAVANIPQPQPDIHFYTIPVIKNKYDLNSGNSTKGAQYSPQNINNLATPPNASARQRRYIHREKAKNHRQKCSFYNNFPKLQPVPQQKKAADPKPIPKRACASPKPKTNPTQKSTHPSAPITIKKTKAPSPIIIDNISKQFTETELASELIKHKKNIEFTSLKKLKRGGLMIFPSTHKDANSLLKPWPENAFGGNIYVHLAKTADFRPWLCLNKYKTNLDIREIKNALLSKNIHVEGLHRVKKGPHHLTTLVKFKTDSEESAKNLYKNGLNIQNVKYVIRKFVNKTIFRCTNCQQIGHLRTTCKNKKRCVRCAESNCKLGDCKNAFRKCANCGGNHSASYKNCPVIKSATKQVFRTTQKTEYRTMLKKNSEKISALQTELSDINDRLDALKSGNSKFKTELLKTLTTSLKEKLSLNQQKTTHLNKFIKNFINIMTTSTTQKVAQISNVP